MAFRRVLALGRVASPEQVAPRLVRAPAHPAPQLVELGDAEAVGVHDHHHGGVGDVDADLDDGGGHQHVDLAGPEGGHHRLLLLGRHLAVEQAQAQVGPHLGASRSYSSVADRAWIFSDSSISGHTT